ncbi:AraC-like DNA-binding protein [Rhizobium mesoamericanum]|nr:AraC-like DNA-binding protein [Rhizobium mesoamericanum]
MSLGVTARSPKVVFRPRANAPNIHDHLDEKLAMKKVAGIACMSSTTGTGSIARFNRIFNSAYGMPRAQYRKMGSHTAFVPHFTKDRSYA